MEVCARSLWPSGREVPTTFVLLRTVAVVSGGVVRLVGGRRGGTSWSPVRRLAKPALVAHRSGSAASVAWTEPNRRVVSSSVAPDRAQRNSSPPARRAGRGCWLLVALGFAHPARHTWSSPGSDDAVIALSFWIVYAMAGIPVGVAQRAAQSAETACGAAASAAPSPRSADSPPAGLNQLAGVPRTRVSSHSLLKAPRGSSRATRRVKSWWRS